MEDLKGFPKEPEVGDTGDNSPKSRKSPRRLSKRKRTSSIDSARRNKPSKTDFPFENHDITFTKMAAPYIDPMQVSCKPCQQAFPTLSELLKHMSAHFSWFRFQCSRCSFMTFDEADCTVHAETVHTISQNDIASVVLPIPNWKTVLMSNKFRELDEDSPLSEEILTLGDGELENLHKVADDNIIDRLFVDSEENENGIELEELPFPMPMENHLTNIKNESIDIIDVDQDFFQLEDPQEMFTTNSFKIVVDDDEGYDFGTQFDMQGKITGVEENFVIMDEPDIDGPQGQSPVAIKEEKVSNKDNEFEEITEEATNHPTVNSRPTRNRVRSFKTLQDDFFYDLGKVIKLNESTPNKMNMPQKQKKNGSGALSKKSEKGLRVYSNKQ